MLRGGVAYNGGSLPNSAIASKEGRGDAGLQRGDTGENEEYNTINFKQAGVEKVCVDVKWDIAFR